MLYTLGFIEFYARALSPLIAHRSLKEVLNFFENFLEIFWKFFEKKLFLNFFLNLKIRNLNLEIQSTRASL